MSRRTARRLFKEAGVALHKEDVKEEIEGEGAEVEECGCKTPVLDPAQRLVQSR